MALPVLALFVCPNSLQDVKLEVPMKIKTFVGGRIAIDGLVNEFCDTVSVVDLQTHLASDQQVIAVVIYEEERTNGR